MLGIWGSPEAKTAYVRFVAELHAHTLNDGTANDGDALVSELAANFLTDIESTKDKTKIHHFKTVIGYFVRTYGDIHVNDFSPKKIESVPGSNDKIRDAVPKYGKYVHNENNSHFRLGR
jgi:hypothetical protein